MNSRPATFKQPSRATHCLKTPLAHWITRAVTTGRCQSESSRFSASTCGAREGDTVKAEQTLMTIKDARDHTARAEQSRGQTAAMAGQLDIAKQTLENNRVLVEKGFISKMPSILPKASTPSPPRISPRRERRWRRRICRWRTPSVRAPFSGQIASRSIEPGGTGGRRQQIIRRCRPDPARTRSPGARRGNRPRTDRPDRFHSLRRRG